MSFGLKKALATPERAVNAIVSSVKWKSAFICLEYIVVSWKTVEHHFSHLQCGLTLQGGVVVTLKIKNYSFLPRPLITLVTSSTQAN